MFVGFIKEVCVMARRFNERLCLWCGKPVGEGRGIVHRSYRGLVHLGSCGDYVKCLECDFSASTRGKLRTSSEVRRLVQQWRGKPFATWIDFPILAHVEPRLGVLLRTAQSYRKERGERFCANELWHGYGLHRGQGLKPLLRQLVGIDRDSQHAVLGSSFAYNLAHDTIYNALPDCRGACGCART
jgi:hypothetical protein